MSDALAAGAALLLVHHRHRGFDLHPVVGQEHRRLGGGGGGLGYRVHDVFGSLDGSGQQDSSTAVSTGASSGCRSRKNPSRPTLALSMSWNLSRVRLARTHADAQHHHLRRDLEVSAKQLVMAPHRLSLLLADTSGFWPGGMRTNKHAHTAGLAVHLFGAC